MLNAANDSFILLALNHFCSDHGPTVVFVSELFRNSSTSSSSSSSSNPSSSMFSSSEYEELKEFKPCCRSIRTPLESHVPPFRVRSSQAVRTYLIEPLKRCCIRSLSVEDVSKNPRPVLFGDQENGVMVFHKFKVRDLAARGMIRPYSLCLIGKGPGVIGGFFSSFLSISLALMNVVSSIQFLADKSRKIVHAYVHSESVYSSHEELLLSQGGFHAGGENSGTTSPSSYSASSTPSTTPHSSPHASPYMSPAVAAARSFALLTSPLPPHSAHHHQQPPAPPMVSLPDLLAYPTFFERLHFASVIVLTDLNFALAERFQTEAASNPLGDGSDGRIEREIEPSQSNMSSLYPYPTHITASSLISRSEGIDFLLSMVESPTIRSLLVHNSIVGNQIVIVIPNGQQFAKESAFRLLSVLGTRFLPKRCFQMLSEEKEGVYHASFECNFLLMYVGDDIESMSAIDDENVCILSMKGTNRDDLSLELVKCNVDGEGTASSSSSSSSSSKSTNINLPRLLNRFLSILNNCKTHGGVKTRLMDAERLRWDNLSRLYFQFLRTEATSSSSSTPARKRSIREKIRHKKPQQKQHKNRYLQNADVVTKGFLDRHDLSVSDLPVLAFWTTGLRRVESGSETPFDSLDSNNS